MTHNNNNNNKIIVAYLYCYDLETVPLESGMKGWPLYTRGFPNCLQGCCTGSSQNLQFQK